MKNIECIKKGLIFKPDGRCHWMKEFAQVPTPLELNDRIRIFYTTRPSQESGQYVSYTSYIDVRKDDPSEILYIHDKPVLDLGSRGTFDEFGIMPGNFVRDHDRLYLYYTGWSRSRSVPYTTAIGLAVSEDNGESFRKISQGPLLAKNIHDPFLVNGPYVIKAGATWYMFYSSCHTWIENNDRIDPIYKIKYATSHDGIHWVPAGDFCIPEKIENEAQNAPTVIFHQDEHVMLFCYRQGIDFRNKDRGYRLDYAVSRDLTHWQRGSGNLSLTGDDSSWDNEMQAYPRLLLLKDRLMLFYNGNEFGKHGFGYADVTLQGVETCISDRSGE